MYRADAGVIQSGRNGIRFFDLSVLILDNESSCSVDDTHFTQLDSSRSLAGFYTFSSGFGQYDAHTFVIAGAGTGSAVFRQLIRQGKAFYAGVLHEGDIDCELARDLATECVAERAFEPIGDKTIARAKELLVHCARLIVCPAAFGTINARNAELVEFARSHGIEVMRACEGASEDSHLEWEG